MAQQHARDPGKVGLPLGTINHLTATREGSPVVTLSFRCQVLGQKSANEAGYPNYGQKIGPATLERGDQN